MKPFRNQFETGDFHSSSPFLLRNRVDLARDIFVSFLQFPRIIGRTYRVYSFTIIPRLLIVEKPKKKTPTPRYLSLLNTSCKGISNSFPEVAFPRNVRAQKNSTPRFNLFVPSPSTRRIEVPHRGRKGGRDNYFPLRAVSSLDHDPRHKLENVRVPRAIFLLPLPPSPSLPREDYFSAS